MIKKLPLFAFLYTLLLACNLFGQSQAIHYDDQPIEKIDVMVMNLPPEACFDSNSVLSRIHTKQGDVFSQTEFDSDLKILIQEFDRVEPIVDFIGGKIFITLRIWPKPKIRTINWDGNERVKSKNLLKELGIACGTVFDRLAFNKAFHKIKAYYVKKGFFEAELSYDINVDYVCNEVDINVTIIEGRSGRVKDIVFHDFTCEEEEEILEMMVTKSWNRITSWLTNEGTYHEEAVQQDKFMILNYLQNEGYADARVTVEVCEAECDHRIILHITAEKGPLYTISYLSFKGNCLFTNEEIRESFTIGAGDPYAPEDLRETIAAITSLYGNRGYIDAYVDYEPKLDPDQCSYSISFTIDEGEQFCIGLIKVFGNCSTQTKTILHEVLFAPGEVFNLAKIRKTEERLRNVGYFETVNVYAVKSDTASGCGDNYRDVHIEVEETSTGNFGAFAGYSTVEDVFGGFNVTEKNFNWRGLPRLWTDGYGALRGGGEYVHFTTSIGQRSRRYVFSWTQPYFMDTPWSVGFDIENSSNRYISRDYDIEAWGFSLRAGYLLNQFLRFGWHYRIRDTHVIIEEKHPSPQMLRAARNAGIVSASGLALVYDSRDSASRPRNGFLSRLQVEFAGIGGEHCFMSYAYLNSSYFPIGKNGVLKYRADFKFIQPLNGSTANTIPLDERFFLGGDDGVRGFRPYAIGPKFPEGDPKGGIALTQYTGEYCHEINSRIDAFLFADAGSLSDHQWEIGDLKVAIGYGLRLKIFEGGPILNIGMGYPLNAHNHSDVKRFFFALGARF